MRITIADSLRASAQRWPEKEALVHRDRRISYASFDAEVDRFASLLVEHGVAKGDRVAVYMEKCPEEAASLLAVARAGGIFVDVNHLLKAPQVEHILRDSGARVLVTTRQRAAGLAEVLGRCTDLETVILHGPGEAPLPDGVRGVDRGAWAEAPSVERPNCPRVVETDVGAIIYTSGSTGKPKGVVLSHRNLVAGAESVSTYVENTPEDRILSVLPFSFDYGLNQLTCSLHVGCTCVLINYLFPNDILKAMEAERITGLGLIPPLWLQLLKLEWDHTRFPHWRYLTNTGGAMPVHATRELRRRLPNTRIYLMYGLTEAFRGTYLPPEEVDRRPTSIGKAIPNAEIWVLNERGEHCKPGEEGELVQRGAHVALGYWNDPQKTAERFRPNPFAPPGLQMQEMVVFSGDRVKTDEEGYIYFVDRADEMIKTSGYRVSPTEVEDALYATGLVEHAVAFGVPDEVLGQVVTAVVSPKAPGLEAQTLKRACAETLPNYMVPRFLEVWDRLPLNPNGKIDRKAVKKEFLSRKD
ncbi:acyl-CoA ligase (AMP-forming), exosortase A system-associated [Deferrisoma palaeochoriense]